MPSPNWGHRAYNRRPSFGENWGRAVPFEYYKQLSSRNLTQNSPEAGRVWILAPILLYWMEMEFTMRKTGITLAAIILITPAAAMACPSASTSSISVTCEQGVKVYRPAPLAYRPAPIRVKTAPKADLSAQFFALQNTRLAAQSERIDSLQAQLDAANKRKRRARYGTTYYGSPFLFGNNRSFGRRSNFGSARQGHARHRP